MSHDCNAMVYSRLYDSSFNFLFIDARRLKAWDYLFDLQFKGYCWFGVDFLRPTLWTVFKEKLVSYLMRKARQLRKLSVPSSVVVDARPSSGKSPVKWSGQGPVWHWSCASIFYFILKRSCFYFLIHHFRLFFLLMIWLFASVSLQQV